MAAEHMQSARAGLPHLPKGDRLLESHARNFAKSHSQSEYGIRHRLTEWHGPAGLIRKVARAAYQRVKQRPRSSPTAPRLPPASAEVAVAFTFEHPDVFSGAQLGNKDGACRRIGTNAAYIAASAVGLGTSKAASLSRNNDTTKAINYCLSGWDAFTRFLDDGRLCMSNNAAERELRAVALGRRNWTFAGSDEGGRGAAAIYTLIATAKLNDIGPQAWLADVLARLPDHPAKRIHELMPWNWRPQNVAHAA